MLKLRAVVFTALGLLAAFGFAGCGGGGTSVTPASNASDAAGGPATTQSSSRVTAAPTISLRTGPQAAATAFDLPDGSSGSITLHSTTAGAALTMPSGAAAASHAANAAGTCPAPSPLVITNPTAHPVTITLESFMVRLPCSVNGLLFGASAYQSKPVPPALVSTKLGDAKGTGKTITFTPSVTTLTFPANTTLTIAILPETSTVFTQLPAVANTALSLTSNTAQVPNSLALTASSVSGGPTFQSACYLPGDPAGPGLAGQPILGTPSFYCVLLPGQSGGSTAFGSNGANGAVTFTLGPYAKPDRSYVGLDGPAIFAPCSPAGNVQTCSAQPFSLPAYSKAIVGNVDDLAVCVPATENTDCNGKAGNPTAPAATTVPAYSAFQLLFADDATYNAGNGFGGVTLQIAPNSNCQISTSPDADNDVPPHYVDAAPPAGATPWEADYAGVGPYVEFDIKTLGAPYGTGSCTIALTEDTGVKRTFTYQITVYEKGT